MNELTIKLGSKAVKRALFLGVIGMLLMSVTVVTTVTSTNLGSSSVKLGTEAFSNDTDVSIIAKGIKLIKTSAAAAGDSASGVEVTSALPAINNTLTKNNYAYEFELKEASVANLQSGENLKIQVYGDDGTDTTLLATLYTQQSIVDDVNVEGVTVTIDLGSSSTIHNNFDILITRQ